MTLRDGIFEAVNLLALVTGVAYAVLAARRNSLCWILGAVSSACAALLSALGKLPMQAALQVFYVGMAFYGWWSWTRSIGNGELSVGLWPPVLHAAAAAALIGVSLLSAYWLRPFGVAAWPFLDSLTTYYGLFATWLTARAKLENWLYWIVINAITGFLFYAQGMWGMAVLSVLLMGVAVSGFIAWRRRYRAQMVAA